MPDGSWRDRSATGNSGARLTQAEIEKYRRDGYVIPDFRIPDDMLAEMRKSLDALIAENPHLAADNMLCPHLLNAGVQG